MKSLTPLPGAVGRHSFINTCKRVLIAGATGYLGSRLEPRLALRGHHVGALVRQRSVQRAPAGCTIHVGDALDPDAYSSAATEYDTLVHLVGVAHPNPRKAEAFRSVDLASAHVAAQAAQRAGVSHIVYVSVAQPAPVMRDYVEARKEAERAFRDTGIACTFLRPWYVIGPGHYWPLPAWPLYKLLEKLPATRQHAQSLGFISLKTMLNSLIYAVEHPPIEARIMDVPAMRALRNIGASNSLSRP